MKLYYTKGACSLACRIIINEIGLDCEYISVDLKSKKTEKGQDFTQINPKGSVPVLITDDEETLTENAVIQQYLADHNNSTDLLPKVRDIKRYHVLEWQNYVATEIHKAFGVLFHDAISNELKEQIFAPIIKKKFLYVDKSLENKSFLIYETFTLPDAYIFVMLTWAAHFNFDLSEWPNITRYFHELKKRPSIKKSLLDEGLSY